MKKQDWIIANINNPGFSAGDFKSIGLTTDDMQLRPIDDYLRSSQITDNQLFKDDNGNFSKTKFVDFYNQSAAKYQKFSQDFDTFKYDLFDPYRKANSEIKDPQMSLYQVSNPEHTTFGILGRNVEGKGDFTSKELAQKSKIFDPSTGTYLDKSMDEMSLFSRPLDWITNLFKDPIVYATYDSDGTHIDPITKREVMHKKGQFRVNEEGEYFTEKLSGRNIRGKEIVSLLDTITSDTSKLNKYDFFDADGFDKSVIGNIFSTSAAIAPLFVPVFGEIYSGFLVSRELSKAFPMLSGMLDSAFGTDIQNNSLLNKIAGRAESLTGGTSEYSRQKMFSFENISKLIADVANQWGQQKIIAKGISKLTGADKIITEANANAIGFYQGNTIIRGQALKEAVKAGQITEEAASKQLKVMSGINDLNELNGAIKSGKWAESALGRGAVAKFVDPAKKTVEGLNRIAADMSLGYMAIVSNTDVYQTLLDHGVTKGEAALFALGSTVGMFSVDRYLGLGELFFDELRNPNRFLGRNIEEMFDKWKGLFNTAESSEKSWGKRIFQSGKEFGKKYVNKYISDLKNHTTGFLGKAFGEGLEEVSEELVTDFTKELYEQLGKYNITSKQDVGAWDNMGSRYLMSFLGGSLGGGIFYGVGMARGEYPLQEANEDLLFHIRNGKAKDYLDKVNEWERDGKFGSKTLSATQFTETKNEDGTTSKVYLDADSEMDSQNHFIAERIRQSIIQLDAIIKGNELDKTDDQLFENLVMSEQRYLDMKDWLKDSSYATNYYQAYQNLVGRIVDIDQKIAAADKTKDGLPDGEIADDEWLRNNRNTEAGKTREENISKLRKQKEDLLKQRDDFLSGDTSFYYTRKMLFALDRQLAGSFFPVSFESFLEKEKGVRLQDLNTVDKEKYFQEYTEYKDKNYKSTIDEQFDKFLEIEKLISPYLKELEENSQNFKEYSDAIFKLFTEESPLNFNLTDYFSVLEGETEEDLERFKRINTDRVSITTSDLDEIVAILSGTEGVNESQYDTQIKELKRGVNVLKNVKDLYQLLPEGALKNKFEDYIFHQERKAKVDEINNQEKRTAYDQIISIVANVANKLDPITYRYLIDKVVNRKRDVIKEIIENNLSKITVDGLTRQDLATISGIISDIRIDSNGNTNVQEIFRRVKDFLDQVKTKTVESKNKVLDEQEDYLYSEFDGLAQSRGYENATELKLADIFGDLHLDVHHKNEEGQIDEDKEARLDEFLSVLNDLLIEHIQEQIDNLDESSVPSDAKESVKALISSLYYKNDGTTNMSDIIEYIKGTFELSQAVQLIDVIDKATDLVWTDLIELKKQKNSESVDIESQTNLFNQVLDLINEKIINSEDIKYINRLESTTRINNPFIEFIKKIGKNIGLDGIEDLLNELFEKINYTLEDRGDFRLLAEQMDLLQNLTSDEEDQYSRLGDSLALIQNYLLAASKTASIMNPYGHNKSVNDYINKHKSELKTNPELLPEISDDTFIIWGQELEKYKLEVKDRITLSKINSVNKQRRFINTKNKFAKARLQFFENLRPHLKFTIDDKEIDLLEGYEQIGTDNDGLKIDLLEELLFNNISQLLAKEYTIGQIFENSKILEKLTEQEGRESFINQLSTRLDENLEYSNFTLYDRLIYFLSVAGLNNRVWNQFIKEEIVNNSNSEIVPLTIQQLVAKIGVSFLSGNNVFREAIEYLSEKKIIDKEKINILSKSVFISGVGGAGKSRVGAKYIVDYAIDKLKINQDSIWITGSTDKVRQNLKNSVVRGIIKETKDSVPGKSELIRMAIDPSVYEKMMEDLNKGKQDSEYYTLTKTKDGEIVTVNWDKVKLNESIAPEILIIDEATHFSSLELQIFDKWAKKACILIGDPNQSGFEKIGGNIDREFSFLVRTPKLRISLRDNNLQNQENQIEVSELLDYISDAESDDPNYANITQQFLQRFYDLKIRGYIGDGKVNGTIYSKALSNEALAGLSGDVAFVGSVNSETYKTLNANSSSFKSFKQFKDVSDIQGSEFDFVIVDYDFASVYNGLGFTPAYTAYCKLKDFYTLISRAKVGSIFIENGEQIGVNILDKSSAQALPITDALETFTQQQLEEIDLYLNNKLSNTVEVEEKEEKEDIKTNPEDTEDHSKVLPITEQPDPVLDIVTELLEPNLATDVTFPAYTIFNVRGARMIGTREIGGVKYPIIAKAQEGQVKRGIEIFLEEDLDPLAVDGDNQENHLKKYNQARSRYERYLRNLMNGILYNHDYSELDIVSNLDVYFSKETYEKLKNNIYLVCREVDSSRDFIMNPVYDGTGGVAKPISGNRIIEIVAEADGISVTLGYVLDPEKAVNEDIIKSLEKNIDRTIARLKKVRDQEKDKGRITVGDELYTKYQNDIAQLEQRKLNLRSDAKKYKEAVEKLASEEPSKRRVKMKCNGFSSLYRTKYRHNLTDVRKNPNVVTSKVLIYAGGLPGVNDAVMKGRAIVLQSGDTLLSPTQLMDEYIKQRLSSTESNPLEEMHSTPRTRMMTLTSKGFDIVDILRGEINTPISWHQFGLKAFVSIWNFRANLINFYKKYEDFLKENHLTTEIVEKVLTNMDNEARKEEPTYEIIPNYEEIKQKINKFNESLNESVKQFRLGGREETVGGIKRGSQYIREIENPNPNFYDNRNKVYGIYIHPERARSFQTTLDAYFNALVEIVNPTESYVDKEDNNKTKTRLLPPERLITTSEASNNIQHYISEMQSKAEYKIGNITLSGYDEKGSRGQFSAFAIATIQILRQGFGVGTSERRDNDIRGTYDDNTKVLKTNVSVGKGNNKTEIEVNTREIFGEVILSPTQSDFYIENLFRLIIHGTTEKLPDIQHQVEDKPMQATDAYFKQGVFVEPSAGNRVNDYFYESETEEDFFELDAVARPPRITIDSIEKEPERKTEEEVVIEETEEQKQRKLKIQQAELQFGPELQIDQTQDNIDVAITEAINSLVQSKITALFINFSGTENSQLDLIVGVDYNTNTPIKLRDLIKVNDVSEIQNITSTKRSITIILNDGKSIKISKTNSKSSDINKKLKVTISNDADKNKPDEQKQLRDKISITIDRVESNLTDIKGYLDEEEEAPLINGIEETIKFVKSVKSELSDYDFDNIYKILDEIKNRLLDLDLTDYDTIVEIIKTIEDHQKSSKPYCKML